jgi:hypothetical protein
MDGKKQLWPMRILWAVTFFVVGSIINWNGPAGRESFARFFALYFALGTLPLILLEVKLGDPNDKDSVGRWIAQRPIINTIIACLFAAACGYLIGQ